MSKRNKKTPWLEVPLEHRAILVSSRKNPEVSLLSEDLQELHKFYKNKACKESTRVAAHLFESDFTRMYMNAFIFGGATDEDIADLTELSVNVVKLYRYFFVDLSVVSNSEFLLRDYIWRLEDDLEKHVYHNSVCNGWRWVAWRYSGGTKGIQDADEILKRLATDAYWRAKEGVAYTINSKEARESRNYARQAAEMATSIKRTNIGSVNAAEDLYLTLTTSDDNELFSEEELEEIKKKLYN